MNLPRNELIRMVVPLVELRDSGDNGPVMSGHFAVFNQQTEIDSWEGRFMEQIAPSAFDKTFRENRSAIKVLFQHGFDPQIGDKPLGAIRELRADKTGAYYEVDLLDASYVREDVLPGLRAGLYGASFKFSVIKEHVDNDGDLPLRTIQELRLYEFGPVTFPAYQAATAGVRSMIRLESLDGPERAELVHLMRKAQGSDTAGRTATDTDKPDTEPAAATPIQELRDELERKRAAWLPPRSTT